MAYSCSTPDISRYHVDKTVTQLMADLGSGLLIKASVVLLAMATVDGRGVIGNLLVAFARIGGPQFVEAFKVVLMEDTPCAPDYSSLEIEVTFVRCKQVAATVS